MPARRLSRFTLLETDALRDALPSLVSSRAYTTKDDFDAAVFASTSVLSQCAQHFPRECRPDDEDTALTNLQRGLEAVVHIMVRVSYCLGKPCDCVFDILPHTLCWIKKMWNFLSAAENTICRRCACTRSNLTIIADSVLVCAKAADSCVSQLKAYIDDAEAKDCCSYSQDIKALENQNGYVTCAAIGEAADHVVLGLANGTVRLWLGRRIYRIFGDFETKVEKVSFSPDFTLIVAQGTDGVVMVWDTNDVQF